MRSVSIPSSSGDANINETSLSSRDLLLIEVLYLLVIGITEYITLQFSPLLGLLSYIIILCTLIYNAAFTGDKSQKKIWLALGFVPIIRIISITTPVILEISRFIWYLIVSIPIIIGLITLIKSLRFSANDIGLNINKPLIQLFVALSGLGLGIIDYFILKTSAWTKLLNLGTTLFPLLILLIFTGFLEELIFRGVLQKAVTKDRLDNRNETLKFNLTSLISIHFYRKIKAGIINNFKIGDFGWIFIAGIYALLQINSGSLLHCIYTFVVGLYFGIIVKYTKSISGVSVAHGIINIGLFLILPYIFKL
jgi:uncharacterized protein